MDTTDTDSFARRPWPFAEMGPERLDALAMEMAATSSARPPYYAVPDDGQGSIYSIGSGAGSASGNGSSRISAADYGCGDASGSGDLARRRTPIVGVTGAFLTVTVPCGSGSGRGHGSTGSSPDEPCTGS